MAGVLTALIAPMPTTSPDMGRPRIASRREFARRAGSLRVDAERNWIVQLFPPVVAVMLGERLPFEPFYRSDTLARLGLDLRFGNPVNQARCNRT